VCENEIEGIMKRVEANDAASIFSLVIKVLLWKWGLQQDHAKSTELYARAAKLGYKYGTL
jgi:hypothetical protein